MKTRTLHKALSMLLTAAMVLNIGLTPVFAAEGVTVPSVSGVCTHHTEHTADCGYKQGTPCNHAHTEDCYTKELTCDLAEGDAPEIATDSDAVVDSGKAPAGEAHTHGEDCYTQTDNCKHEHSADCGYTPNSPCSFDAASCAQCKPANQPIEKVCICPPVDSGNLPQGELVHGKDCPLYTAPELSEAVQALIAMVDVLPNAEDITEENRETVKPDFEAALTAYEALSIDDKAAFEATGQYTKLMALRDMQGLFENRDFAYAAGAVRASGWLEAGASYTKGSYNCIVFSSDANRAVILCVDEQPQAANKDTAIATCISKGGRLTSFDEFACIVLAKSLSGLKNYYCYEYERCWNDNYGLGHDENSESNISYFIAFDINRNPITPKKDFVSKNIYDASAFTVATDNFTWLGGGTPTIVYYVDENGTKTTTENSGAASEGAAPVNVGNYLIKLSTEAVTVDGVAYEPSDSDYIPIGILDGAPVEITGQPEPTSATYGYSASTAPSLSLTAAPTDGMSEVTYQWYRVGTGAGNTDEKIGGATQASYTVPVGLNVGAYSYYCAAICVGYPLRSDTVTVTVVQSGTAFDGGVTADKSSYTYGETITVTAKPKATGVATFSLTPPTANQMALFVNGTQISDPVDANGSGVYTMTYNTTGKALAIGSNTITAKYVGNINMADYSDTVTVTLAQKVLTATVTAGATATKVYDGNANFTNVALTIGSGVIESGDSVTATASGTPFANGKDVGATKTFIATGVTLTGTGSDYYSLAPSGVTGTVAITKKALTITGGTVAPKQWDGSNTATVTALTFSGLVEDEQLIINTDYSAGSPTYNDATVNTNKTVTGTAWLDSIVWKALNYSLTNSGAYTITGNAITLADGPAAPTFNAMDDTANTYTFNSTNGTVYEYSLNSGSDWTEITASATTMAIPVGNIAIAVGALQVRVKATATHNAGAILSNATAFTASIEGSVAISGAESYGNTLTATASGYQSGAVLTYTWKDGSTTLQSGAGNTYVIAGAAVGKTVTVEVTATGYTGKLTSDTSGTIGKKAVTATAGTISKVYDGTAAVEAADRTLIITKVNAGDSITITAPNATYNNANVGSGKQITFGTLNITGAAADWYDVTAPTATGEITAKLLTTATVTVSGTYTYTGTAQTPGTGNITVMDDSTTLAHNTDYTYVASDNTNAGTATVTVTFTGNYSGTATKAFTIGKAPLTITGYTADNKSYDGTTSAVVSAVTFSGTQNSETLALNTDYTVSATFASKDVGTGIGVSGTATLTSSEKAKNYSLAIGTLSGQSANITAINPAYNVANQNIKIGKTLTGIQAALTATGANSETVAGTLTWATTNGGSPLDSSYAFSGADASTVTLYWSFTPTGGNYNALSGSTTFTLTEKEVPVLAVSNITKNYDGTAITTVTGTAKVGSTTVAGTFAFASGTPEMKNANTYNATVEFTPTNNTDYTTADISITVTINKVAVTVTADSKDILVGATVSYTATTTGLVNSETISGVTFTPANPDTSTKGVFTITPAGGTVSGGGNGNYTITYATGTLTISVDVSSITTAITAANSAKSGISTDDRAASQVANGTKFVTTAEMSALTTAISAATAAKATVSTAAEVTTATSTLNNAVTTFNAAIKTGTYTSGGGGGGGDTGGSSGGGSIVTPPVTPENPNPPTTAESNVSSKTDKNGNATATASEKDITNAIDKAQKEAKKNGTEKNGIAITLNVKTDKNATTLGVTLLQKSVSALIAANVTSVTVKNDLSTVTLDLATLKALAVGDVILSVKKADTAKLSKEAQTAIGNRPVFQYGLTSGGKTVSDFKGGRAGLQIPYTRTTTEQAGNLCGVYVDASGKVNWLETSSYDPITGMMLISAQHFSTYGIGYKQSTPKFTDVGTHWAKNDIDFVVARGLLSGTSNTTFAPETSMTRGMFVTALGRLAGIDTKKYTSTKFTDVKANAYYAPYVAWANTNNIVNGTSDTEFSPDKAITRQEMAVMLVNYAKAIGYKLPSVHAEVTFTDAGSIASWAKDAVKQMQMAGILTGKSGNKFDPTATATRAEVSAMLRRFVELVASTETAEGWSMNESGQWMYIENGKRTTGKKTVDGKSYTFDQYGVTTAAPPERKYLTYTVQKGDSFWAIAFKHKVSMFELAAANGKTIFSIIHAGDVLQIPKM